jgi:hypothetical protein
MNNKPIEESMNGSNGAAKKTVVHDDSTNGIVNGLANGRLKDTISKKVAMHRASGLEGVDGLHRNLNSSKIHVSVNGYTNGMNGSAH